jgi:hypothetical protein
VLSPAGGAQPLAAPVGWGTAPITNHNNSGQTYENMQHITAAVVLALGPPPPPCAEPFLYVSDSLGSQLIMDVGPARLPRPFNEPGCDAIAVSSRRPLHCHPGLAARVEPQLAAVDVATGDATPFGVNLSPKSSWASGSPRRQALRRECRKPHGGRRQPVPARSGYRRGYWVKVTGVAA